MTFAALVFSVLAAQAPSAEVMTLDQAIQIALSKNLDLQVAQARLDQAHEISNKVWAAYLPQITASGAFTYNDAEAKIGLPTSYYIRDAGSPDSNGPPAGGSVPGSPSNYIMYPSSIMDITIQKHNQLGGQVQLNQALLVPALWPAIRNAYIAEKVAELGTANARREILFAVTQLYYGAVGLKEVAGVQENLLANNKDHERDAQNQFDAGATLKITLLRAQIDRAKAEQDLRRAQNAYASAKIALATLLGRDENFDVQHPDDPSLPNDTAGLQKTAEESRVDLQAARAGADLANANHNGTWYKYLPSLVGSAVYRGANVTGFTGKPTSWALTAAVSWTLWDGGLRESELRETEAKLVEARATLRSTELKVHQELTTALLDLESARANRTKAEEQAKLARENSQLVDLNFQNGVAKQLDVSDASTALAGAELGAIAERLNAQLAALRLLKAAGLFNPEAGAVQKP